jgi:hypothetical protein
MQNFTIAQNIDTSRACHGGRFPLAIPKPQTFEAFPSIRPQVAVNKCYIKGMQKHPPLPTTTNIIEI